MSVGRAITLGIVVCLGPLVAQDCPPVARILPNGTLTGSLGAANCRLADRTPYASYRLDLPVRGQIRIELAGSTGDLFLALRDASGSLVASGASLARPIEAGSYTLLINGRAAGQSGSYTVNTSFTSEPGILCSGFPNIGRSQTAEGRLPGSGCLALDGTSYEAYTLTTDGAGTLTVTVTSPDFTPLIAIRSIDGRPLSVPATGPVNVVLAGDSQYLVIVSSTDKTMGAYQIATTWQTAGGETCRPQKTLAAADINSGSDSNAITADSCFVTLAGSGDRAYYTYYNFTLAEAGLVSASAVSGDFTSTLKLLDGAGNILATDSGGGGNEAQYDVRSSLRGYLPAGIYSLRVFSDLPTGGNYVLQYAFDAGNPQPCTAGVLNPGDQVNAALSAAGCRTSVGLSDLYTFTLPSAGTVDLEMGSMAFDTVLAIRDGKDNLIVRNEEVDGLSVAHVAADLPAGAYTVLVAAASGAGYYHLAAKFTAHSIPECTFVQSLDLNGGFVQRLGPRSCTGANGQPVDYYTFTLAADALVLAVVTSSEIDGYLSLYDAGGKLVRNDDGGYGSNDPLIVQYLPAGTYKLEVRDASSTVGGLYEVDLRTVTGPRPPLCTPRSTVTAGTAVTGIITYAGCQYTDNAFADVYQMDLPADATIDLRLNSTEFDTYLVLLDSKSAVIDEDDDNGGNTNSRITRDLPAGTYFLVVEPLEGYTGHGAYSLTVKTTS